MPGKWPDQTPRMPFGLRSLGAVVGMMIWLWVTSVVVLVGAELNAELEHQTSEIQQREGRTRI
jgi:uncharacterized BrkB/YihY/UPF0761 family membrane protein